MEKSELYEAIGRKVVQIARQTEIVSFAAKAKKGGGKKSQTCNPSKSHSCTRPDGSNYCISLNRKCRAPAKGTAKQAADYTAEKVKTAKAPKKAAKSKVAKVVPNQESPRNSKPSIPSDSDLKLLGLKGAGLQNTKDLLADLKQTPADTAFRAALLIPRSKLQNEGSALDRLEMLRGLEGRPRLKKQEISRVADYLKESAFEAPGSPVNQSAVLYTKSIYDKLTPAGKTLLAQHLKGFTPADPSAKTGEIKQMFDDLKKRYKRAGEDPGEPTKFLRDSPLFGVKKGLSLDADFGF